MNVDELSKRVSKELDVPYDKVKEIISNQFKFIVEVMKDDDDTRDILLNELFRFKLKKRFKENKTNKYSPYEENS